MVPLILNAKLSGNGFEAGRGGGGERWMFGPKTLLNQLAVGDGEPPWTGEDRVAIYLWHVEISV